MTEQPDHALAPPVPADQPDHAVAPLVPIVGVGASAGGLKSIESFFDHLKTELGAAIVVVQHLSPDFKSLMGEILSRRTSMPIEVATDGMQIQADCVYLIPPGKELRCVGHQFALSGFPAGLHRPIDTFFQSMAMLEGTPIAGIVLSGTGTDGSEGIRAIHRVGGLTISESLETAEFDGMPRTAMATECIDHVLKPEEMPAILHQNIPVVTKPDPLAVHENLAGVQLIYSLLGSRFGISFDAYKPKTITRRIERRQQLTKTPSVFAYAERLGHDTEELDALYHDLLIGVTKFFRDSPAFEALESELASVIENHPEGETFRVWCAGCATGEEAYSIAMIVLDQMEKLGRRPLLKVFATDVHQRGLNAAALGVFPEEAIEFVSLERQKKYFERLDSNEYRVTSLLRKHLVFARHNLIEDPPFLNIHLASCRNVLIYFGSHAQLVSLTALGFSLVDRGLLLLGSSETLGDLQQDFVTIDRTWRLFRRLRGGRPAISPANIRERRSPTPVPTLNILNPDQPERLTVRMLLDVYEAVLREKVLQGVLLDPSQNVIHIFGEAHTFLKSVSGRLTGAIRDYLDDPARTTVASALLQAKSNPGTIVQVNRVQPEVSSDHWFDVSVQAVTGRAAESIGWVVEFCSSEQQEPPVVRIRPDSSDNIEMLEAELNFTKETLSATIEELEASNEELQATNEEMIASNEELQSTNEELHSVNEELHSVNAEYQRKIDELHETTNDLENLLNTSDVATIFLGPDLCIRRFTQAATRYFDLMHHDIGRPLSNFTNRLGYANLHDDVQDVLETGHHVSQVHRSEYDELVVVCLAAYRTGEVVAGVLLTIIKQPGPLSHLAQLATAESVGYWHWPEVSKDEMVWDRGCYELLGMAPADCDARLSAWTDLLHPADGQIFTVPQSQECPVRQFGAVSVRLRCADGSYRKFKMVAVSQKVGSDRVTSMTGLMWHPISSHSAIPDTHKRGQHLERVTRDLQEFAHAVSHDQQTPMRQLHSTVDELQDLRPHADDTDEGRQWDRVKAHTAKMQRMLGCLLEYSQVNTHGDALGPVDPIELVDDVLKDQQQQIDATSARIVAKQLPPAHGDASQLRTVLWHLIDNALKYRDGEPEIEIAATIEDDGWRLSVQDNGIGVPPTSQRDVFVIFRRLRQIDVDGAGFGLALCKRIVERHGGRIWLESATGVDTRNQGATVYVVLPNVVNRNEKASAGSLGTAIP